MKIAFASLPLPREVAVARVPGERECTLLLNEDASMAEVAEALTDLVAEWAAESWIYVGGVVGPHLRAVGD